MQALRFKKPCSPCVHIGTVLSAIQLNDKLCSGAIKISHVRRNRMLPAELETIHAPCT